jgi:hypothetical protein
MFGISIAELDTAHHGVVDELDAAFANELAKMILENAAVNLPGWRRQHAADPEFGDALEITAPVAPEKPKAELGDMCAVQVLAQAQCVGKIMSADLDLGFTNLECRKGCVLRSSTTMSRSGNFSRNCKARQSPASPPPRMTTSCCAFDFMENSVRLLLHPRATCRRASDQ